MSGVVAFDGPEQGKSTYPSLGLGNSFSFKFEDIKGHVHRFNCGGLCIVAPFYFLFFLVLISESGY